MWMEGVWLRQTRRGGGGGGGGGDGEGGAGADAGGEGNNEDNETSGSQHISIQFSGGVSGFPGWDGDMAWGEEGWERGYWAGGPVVVRVGRFASVFLSGCRLTSDGGTALLAEGEPPGNLPYILDDEVEVFGVNGFENCLLPYGSKQLVTPRLDMRTAYAMLRDCKIGPCRGPVSTGLVAGMQGYLDVSRTVVHDIGATNSIKSAIVTVYNDCV